jgi:hypothetical protein
MSWALRRLATKDPESDRSFVNQHKEQLASRIRREVRHKIDTGRRGGRLGPPHQKMRANRLDDLPLNLPSKPEEIEDPVVGFEGAEQLSIYGLPPPVLCAGTHEPSPCSLMTSDTYFLGSPEATGQAQLLRIPLVEVPTDRWFD